MASGAADPGRRAEQTQTADRVWTAILSLPDHHREVLVLCDLEERADSEVAELLRVPKGTVKSRLRYAVAKLRGELSQLRSPLGNSPGASLREESR